MRIQRARKDLSQRLRFWLQIAFIALNAWIGVRFYFWVRAYESGSTAGSRPSGVDGWLPIAGLMNLKAWLATGAVPAVHPAAMFLLIAFVLISIVLKKAFCSWLCPVGTASEYLWKLGRRLFIQTIAVPKWIDIPLRSLKYLLLAFFVRVIALMPADQIGEFMRAPYGIIADVKLLNFFRFIGTAGLSVIAILVMLSMLINNFWCRYLCPYGALLGIASMISPARIRRDADKCIDCAKCAKACPARLPVDVKPQVRSAECTLCMSCVAVCPVRDALQVKVTKRRALSAWSVAAMISAIFVGVVAAARISGHWRTNVPDVVYRMLVPAANDQSH